LSSGSEFFFEDYETLMLDGMLIPEVQPSDRVFVESFNKLIQLSMNACGLRTLVGFCKLPNLKRLELQDNKLTSIVQLTSFCKLESLKVSNNFLATETTLKPLAGLQKLRSIYLAGNPLCELLDHNIRVFATLPFIRNMDGISREGEDNLTDEYDQNEEAGNDGI
jgi:acidic leucine-rich nuclear phosphoprotein 32 family protein A/C/D